MTSPNKISIPGGSFEEASHRYRDMTGMIVPSVTQVISLLGMVDYSHIREEILARKSLLGTAVHRAVEYLCQGCLDWDSVDETAMPYVVATETWMREQEFVSESQEGRGICEISGMKF